MSSQKGSRQGCNSDDDCLEEGNKFCDDNVDCFGITWNTKDIDTDLLKCNSAEMIAAPDGWDTLMKNGK